MLIKEIIQEKDEQLKQIFKQCKSVLLTREAEILMQHDLVADPLPINIEGLVGVLHTVNMFGGLQGYNKIRQVEFRAINVIYTNFQDLTIAFIFTESFEKKEIEECIKLIFNVIYSIFRGITKLSQPSTEIEIAASLLSLIFVVNGALGKNQITVFKGEDLRSHVEKIVTALDKESYQELKEFSVEQSEEVLNVNSFLEELKYEINGLIGAGVYFVDTSGKVHLSKWGEISDEQQEKILEIYLENASQFINLSEELKSEMIFDIEDHFLYFFIITDISGLYVIVERNVEMSQVASSIEKFAHVLVELFPDEVMVR